MPDVWYALSVKQPWATLLAAGCWPGALRGATTNADVVRFVVANDFHHDSAECDPWFEKLFAQIGQHDGLSFCAGLGDLAHRGRPESIAAIVRSAGKIGVPF